MITLTLKKGTHSFLGSLPVEFLDDTKVGIAVDSVDEAAEKLSAAGQKVYGEHLGELAHEETANRMVDGELKEVTLNVTYGAGGARIETQVGDPRPVKAPAPVPTPVGSATVAPAPAVDPLAQRASEFQERTEFAPAAGRFPDEHANIVMDAGPVPETGSGDTGSEVSSDPDNLPEDFPHRKELEDNGITKYSQLEGKSIDDLSGPEFKGIGLVKAQDIVDTLNKRGSVPK